METVKILGVDGKLHSIKVIDHDIPDQIWDPVKEVLNLNESSAPEEQS